MTQKHQNTFKSLEIQNFGALPALYLYISPPHPPPLEFPGVQLYFIFLISYFLYMY